MAGRNTDVSRVFLSVCLSMNASLPPVFSLAVSSPLSHTRLLNAQNPSRPPSAFVHIDIAHRAAASPSPRAIAKYCVISLSISIQARRARAPPRTQPYTHTHYKYIGTQSTSATRSSHFIHYAARTLLLLRQPLAARSLARKRAEIT